VQGVYSSHCISSPYFLSKTVTVQPATVPVLTSFKPSYSYGFDKVLAICPRACDVLWEEDNLVYRRTIDDETFENNLWRGRVREI
jgi:hypothetical protein